MDRFELQHLPFAVETGVERAIVADATWRRGMLWGAPRPGHPEGQVLVHVGDVLANVDRFADPRQRSDLRVIALLHDACKFQVRAGRGWIDHGVLAKRLAERFVHDEVVLDVIELHDEAYRCWRLLDRGRPGDAHDRADALLERITSFLDLYLAFYRCDSMTVGKHRDALDWFERFVE